VSAGPGQVANSLRAWARYWHRRTGESMVKRLVRVAERIEDAAVAAPEARDLRALHKAAAWAEETSRLYAKLGNTIGAAGTSDALDRAASCIRALLAEGANHPRD
jgi:hypothetical protein